MFKHLHIVACSPRSGSTLLHEAMVTCFDVDKHYEHEVRFNLAWADEGEVLVTKRPKDTMYMPELMQDDPDVYTLYMLRDPRDVIVSRHAKDKSKYYSNIRLWRELHAYAKQMSDHPNFLEIKYEDFVNEPDKVQDQIAAKFPWLTKKHNFSDYHEYAKVSSKSSKAMHGVRPIAPTSVGRWHDNLARIKGQQDVHGSLTPDLIECGYEDNDDWEISLDDIEADYSRSRYPERVYFWKRIGQKIDAYRKISSYRAKRARSRMKN
jgi:hypothetical protein